MEFNGKPIIFCEYDDEFTLGNGYDEGNQLSLGNDGIFLVTFFIAFIFNWIGFFLSFCSTNTIAGRYGAISGFGLSLIKWILIVRFSDYFIGYFEGKIWLWWIFLVVGFVLFTRGFVNYAKVRKMTAKIASLKKSRYYPEYFLP
ncbi:NEDD4 family-interacting protein 1-like isoform X1 [Hemiscyllium ocellatum]|uniref:NEDD4 family-interacting protein 1-like isoform X1 n=1 Tax=Hemiscyllium ocellatum TaxID=170820 RepID=UPI002965F21C|nr:NEDD4 family-interacting protein 1-like isoform X1 [Hemiscyllium ocellatum]